MASGRGGVDVRECGWDGDGRGGRNWMAVAGRDVDMGGKKRRWRGLTGSYHVGR